MQEDDSRAGCTPVGQELCDALINGMTDSGADVVDTCGTEMVYFALTSTLMAVS